MIDYRLATLDDVGGMDRVVRAAYNALSRKHGFPEIPRGPPNPFYTFAILEEGADCWVAEDEGSVVGVSISSFRERWHRGGSAISAGTRSTRRA